MRTVVLVLDLASSSIWATHIHTKHAFNWGKRVHCCCLLSRDQFYGLESWTAAESFEGSHLSRPWGTKSHSLRLFLTFNTRSHFEKLRDLNAKYRPTVGKFSVVVLCLSTCTYPWIYCMYMAVFYSAHYPYHK